MVVVLTLMSDFCISLKEVDVYPICDRQINVLNAREGIKHIVVFDMACTCVARSDQVEALAIAQSSSS